MSPAVVKAIVACLRSGPDFADFAAKLSGSGFELDKQRNEDRRWRHANGHEAFVSHLPHERVCSVWFREDFNVAASEIDKLVTDMTTGEASLESDEIGPLWRLEGGMTLRAFVKKGSDETVGAALFARQE